MDNITGWFTTDTGVHIPLKNGETKEQAIENFFNEKEKIDSYRNSESKFEFETDDPRQKEVFQHLYAQEENELANIYDDMSIQQLREEINDLNSDDSSYTKAAEAQQRIRNQYEYMLSDNLEYDLMQLESMAQEHLNNKINNLTLEEVRNSSLDELLGKENRRYSAYGDDNQVEIMRKIDTVVDDGINKIADELREHGYQVSLDDSRISESRYITVESKDGNEYLDFRLSDHTATGSGSPVDAYISYEDNYGNSRTLDDTLWELKNTIRETISDEWNEDPLR